jgi:DNA-binding protein Fis
MEAVSVNETNLELVKSKAIYDFAPIINKMFDEGDDYQTVIKQFQDRVMSRALIETRGNQTKASKLLGLNRGTFRKWMSREK